MAIGCTISRPGALARGRRTAAPRPRSPQRSSRIGPSRSRAPPLDQRRAEAPAPRRSRPCSWRTSTRPCARGEPEHREQAEQRAERQLAAVDQRRQQRRRPAPAAASAKTSAASRQLPKAACSSRKRRDRGGDRDAEHTRSCRSRRPPCASAPRRGTRAGSSARASRSSISPATASSAAAADAGARRRARRETASRSIDDRASARRARRPRRPSRTCPPPGGRSAGCARSATLRRVAGVPRTTTSKTFCSSKMLPTWMPCSSVASARRTSPGLMPKRCALSRSTSISMVGCVAGSSTCRVDHAVDAAPRAPRIARASRRSIARSCP